MTCPFRLASLLVGALALPGAAQAAKSVAEQMLALDLDTRIEQRCNARAMGEISRTNRAMRPDELVAYAFKDSELKDDVVRAPGAAVRSGNAWYRLSYVCRATPDGLDVLWLSFRLGPEIPRSEWEDHQLVPQ